jgi:hypothetical protein
MDIVRISLLVMAAALLSAETAKEAMTTIRDAQYQGDNDSVETYLAPVAIGLVLRKSKEASRENVQRIADRVYGYRVVEVWEEGKAACAVLVVGQSDKKPATQYAPFFFLRMKDGWKYLPNPITWDAWYQSIPSDAKKDFQVISKKYKQWKSSDAPELPTAESLIGNQ